MTQVYPLWLEIIRIAVDSMSLFNAILFARWVCDDSRLNREWLVTSYGWAYTGAVVLGAAVAFWLFTCPMQIYERIYSYMPKDEEYIPIDQFKSIVQGLVTGTMVVGLLIGYYFYSVVCRYCRLADEAELADNDDLKRDQRENLLSENNNSR